MKLKIEVELEPEEIPLATEMFNILRQITSHVKANNTPKLFRSLVSKLEDSSQLDSVSNDVQSLFENGAHFDEFFESFMAVVFDPELVSRSQSVVPFFGLLPRLPEPQKTMMRDNLIPKVLKFLTIKRTLECNRMEFFSYAEAFAALVKLEFVSITGAVTTITTLLQKAETRCAAITMLGKTVELCLNLLNEKCEPAELQELRICLANINEEVFRYDVNYIEENMNWKSNQKPMSKTLPSKSPMIPAISEPLVKPMVKQVSSPLGVVPSVLVATSSFINGHTNTIFAICYDDIRDQLISTGKDGMMVAWTKDGKQKEKLAIARHYACSMDVNPRNRSLFICGVAKDAQDPMANPALIGYGLNEKGNWVARGTLERSTAKLVSCVKALVNDSGNFFVTGESAKSTIKREEVRVYDANSNSFDKLQPLCSYEEHADIITSLTHFPASEALFFSGSRDCTVKLWDRRQAKSVGTFGTYQPQSGKIAAHDGMITCLDSYDSLLVSAGLDKKVLVWDLRTLDSTGYTQPVRKLPVDDQAVLKVAIGPGSASVAVSTLKGLYLVDIANGSSRLATPFTDGRVTRRYHDLKWNGARNILYAAGDDMRVDLFLTA